MVRNTLLLLEFELFCIRLVLFIRIYSNLSQLLVRSDCLQLREVQILPTYKIAAVLVNVK